MAAEGLRVRVVIPHYFAHEASGPQRTAQAAARRLRELAFFRCLLALQGQRRRRRDLVLNLGERLVDLLGPVETTALELPELRLEIQVVSNGRDRLEEVLSWAGDGVSQHVVQPQDPRELVLEARDLLVADPEPADLWLYIEDDLVLDDPLFFDKQWWWLQRTQHRQILMPHRYELVRGGAGGRLLVDGPMKWSVVDALNHPEPGMMRQVYAGREMIFDRAANPNAGLFLISELQRQELQKHPLPREGFMGPRETASTLTVLHRYPVFKPALSHRRFLMVEHGHPSSPPLVETLPMRPLSLGESLGRLDW